MYQNENNIQKAVTYNVLTQEMTLIQSPHTLHEVICFKGTHLSLIIHATVTVDAQAIIITCIKLNYLRSNYTLSYVCEIFPLPSQQTVHALFVLKVAYMEI